MSAWIGSTDSLKNSTSGCKAGPSFFDQTYPKQEFPEISYTVKRTAFLLNL